MAKISGSCLCGAVRYASAAEPILTAFCHCRHCQKAGGGGYSVNVGVPTAALEVHGETRTFQTTGESGLPVLRRFCPQCGSPVLTDVTAFAGMTFVKGPTLDDSSWIEPSLHIWCDSAQPWDRLPAGATRVPKNPPAA